MAAMLTLALLGGAFVAFGVFVVLAYRRQWRWTGLPAASAASTGAEGRPAKTLWDWLQLLGIPVALAALAFLLNDAQSSRDQRREEQQSRRDQRREDQRAAQQRTTAADTERENTLRTYLAQMSDLMLERQLLRSRPGADVRNVARTATLTAVRRLDGARRGLVVQFLAEARLLRRGKDGSARVLVFSADLRGADLSEAYLDEAYLVGANLSGAILHEEVNLSGANLRGANVGRANLSGARLVGADFRGANLGKADLRGANLSGARLVGANLRGVDFREADLSRANLGEADLRGANLSRADFREATLRGANFRGANLSRADFRGARDVDMTGSRGVPTHRP
jgi:uncharacterized protein YjbI with pentapeptide repeats